MYTDTVYYLAMKWIDSVFAHSIEFDKMEIMQKMLLKSAIYYR